MTTYSDYFDLAKDYYAAISRHNINLEGNRWQHTYPHETFIELLKKMQAMLGREQKRPLWIEGIYGTGKSRVAWTLRELLLCPDAELSAYFNSYEDLRRETDLRDKLLGHKQGRIIAPMRFSSSEISGLNDLIMAVYASINEELEKQGLNTLAEKTLTGGVIRWLEDEDNSNYMTSLLAKEPYKSDGAYSGISGAEARQRLMAGTHHDLLLAIMKIARERNIQAITFGMDDLCAWIKEVIAINNLKAIVFIWDEFSNYFMQNPTTFGTFQELAQLADTTPFYLVLITQAIATLFAEADQSAKILTKRFNIQHISLPDSTAFKLIGHGLKIKDVYRAEWNCHRDDLNSRLEDARRAIVNVVPELDQEDFKRILPIHPYAAYVLKNVAAVFDSNQRSMFEFIENNEEGMQAFRWFIANHSPENADILSVDQLWDYFYKTGRSPSGALGRSNLDMQVRDIMDSYPALERKYPRQGDLTDSPEHRVLKTIIILQALAKKNPKDMAFQATEENLRAAFNGIAGLESGIGVSIAKRLVTDKVLFEDRGVYQVPIGVGVDQVELYEHIERTRKQLKTKDLIRDFELKNILASDPSFERRFGVIYRASIDDFKPQLNRLINEEDNGYRMKAMLCFARNDLEARELASCLAEATRSDRIGEILLIDATTTRLPEKKQEEWIEATARSAYFARKDAAQSKNAADAATSLLTEWESAIRDGRFRLWSKKYPDGLPCNTGENLKDQLKAAVTARFPYTFDYVQGRTEALFKQPNIKAITAALTEEAATPISRQQVENILTGVKGLPEYWKLSPDLPLSRLKRRLDGKIANAFAPGGPGKISIRELGDDLLKNGFMPSLLYAWLTAFLLKEYADSSYRYSDGQTGDAMSAGRLADIISSYFKMLNGADPRYRDMYLEKLTKEQRAFAKLAGDVFNVDAAGSPEHIARAITARVKDFGYPLWCLDVECQ